MSVCSTGQPFMLTWMESFLSLLNSKGSAFAIFYGHKIFKANDDFPGEIRLCLIADSFEEVFKGTYFVLCGVDGINILGKGTGKE